MVIKLNLSGHENAVLAAEGFIFPGVLHVDMADPELSNKVVEFLRSYINSGDTVYLAAPGLAPLAILVVVAVHGLSGHFPVLVPLVRTEEGFIPSKPLQLQNIRNEVARKGRNNAVKL